MRGRIIVIIIIIIIIIIMCLTSREVQSVNKTFACSYHEISLPFEKKLIFWTYPGPNEPNLHLHSRSELVGCRFWQCSRSYAQDTSFTRALRKLESLSLWAAADNTTVCCVCFASFISHGTLRFRFSTQWAAVLAISLKHISSDFNYCYQNNVK